MYNKILVPLDGSKRAEAILPHAVEMANRYGAEIIFLRVEELFVLGLRVAARQRRKGQNEHRQYRHGNAALPSNRRYHRFTGKIPSVVNGRALLPYRSHVRESSGELGDFYLHKEHFKITMDGKPRRSAGALLRKRSLVL